MRSGCGVLLAGKRVAFPWSKPLETARSLFSKSIPSEDITSSERQCWLLHGFGLSLEFLVEVLRIDVQLLLGRLLRLGGGLGDLVSATRQSFQDHKLSRSMQIIPQKPVLSVGIPPMRTVHTKGCSLSVRTRTVGTRCTLIWLARGILPCERSYFGKTGVRRAPCQCTLMPRTKKPKSAPAKVR